MLRWRQTWAVSERLFGLTEWLSKQWPLRWQSRGSIKKPQSSGYRKGRSVFMFRSSRIHWSTGHTNPAMGNLVSGSAERPGNPIDAAEIPIVRDNDVAIGQGARPTERPEKTTASARHMYTQPPYIHNFVSVQRPRSTRSSSVDRYSFTHSRLVTDRGAESESHKNEDSASLPGCHGRAFSIYLCPLSFWLTLPRGVLSTYDVVHGPAPFVVYVLHLVSGINSLYLIVIPILVPVHPFLQSLHPSLFPLLIHHSAHPGLPSRTIARTASSELLCFSERELTFTFAICYRPPVCLSSVCRL